jgi:hypothetical protein
MEEQMEQSEIEDRIKGLEPDKAKAVVCALIGHSRIVTTCFGYIHCARCEAQIGDSLGGSSTTRDNVIVGHACDKCHENFAQCDWRDTFMTPDPFDPKEVAEQERARKSYEEWRAGRAPAA